MRCGTARRADADDCGFATFLRRTIAAAKRVHAMANVSGLDVRAPVGETDRARHGRPVTSSATASQIRCLSRVMHRRVHGAVFRYRTARAFAAWPGDWSFPRVAWRRSWGSLPFAGLLPRTGGRSFLIDRAHVPLRSLRPTRLIFVGWISPPHKENESKQWAANPG